MPTQISLPYNKKFRMTITTNADWIQEVVVKDFQTNRVYGPYSGQGNNRLIGDDEVLTTSNSSNENGYRFTITIKHLNADNNSWKESIYKIFPLGSTSVYLRVASEDRSDVPAFTDYNDCIIDFKLNP